MPDDKALLKLKRAEIEEMRTALSLKERSLLELEKSYQSSNSTETKTLTNDDIARYSRQLILPDFGVCAQLKLKQSAILIVGMGGLGSPAAQYLVAAGCGCVGVVDYDEVDISNFHRQILHTGQRIGLPKVESARQALNEINPHCRIETYCTLLNSKNAMELLPHYDVVLDCSDNVATRYLLNDTCVLLHKPLVSGSALQLDGQLTVYNYQKEKGPCYRCLFPVPPPAETVANCSDSGVLGAVTGVIGTLQALEAIKIIVGLGNVLAGRLLIFDGMSCSFRNIKLRSRRVDCDICSTTPSITKLIDYEMFCGMRASDKDIALSLVPAADRISVQQYKALQRKTHLLFDVRSHAEFNICHLPQALNMPLKSILKHENDSNLDSYLRDRHIPVVVLCRRGNDSQIAVQFLSKKYPQHTIKDIVGGLHAWHYQIDKNFPIY